MGICGVVLSSCVCSCVRLSWAYNMFCVLYVCSRLCMLVCSSHVLAESDDEEDDLDESGGVPFVICLSVVCLSVVYLYVCVFVRVCARVCCVYVRICVYICVYACSAYAVIYFIRVRFYPRCGVDQTLGCAASPGRQPRPFVRASTCVHNRSFHHTASTQNAPSHTSGGMASMKNKTIAIQKEKVPWPKEYNVVRVVCAGSWWTQHTHTHTHAPTHTRTHTHTPHPHPHTHTHTHTLTHSHRHTRMHTHKSTHTRTQANTRTHKQTHAHTNTQTHAHTNTQTHAHTNTQTHTHMSIDIQ